MTNKIQLTKFKYSKIITIVGARPQFIKTPLISSELARFANEILVHTGQHYDNNMSKIFFEELKIKKPKYNLGIGSDTQGRQTGKMLEKIEKVLLKEKPDLVIIYGDTNSTVAGALAAVKLHIPVAHVEAGMRSYNREMPEEHNRIVSDHLSDLLFCPTKSAVKILNNEGIRDGVYWVGDVMADIQMKIQKLAKPIREANSKFEILNKSQILKKLKMRPKEYILVTVHREENTNNQENLVNIIKAFSQIKEQIIWPVHPRTKKYLQKYHLNKILFKSPQIKLIEPVGYLEMIALENNAKTILTDSGGIQKEAYIARVPCVTLRNETEWIETVKSGWNKLVGTDIKKIVKFTINFPKSEKNATHPNFLGDGKAYVKITRIIREYLRTR